MNFFKMLLAPINISLQTGVASATNYRGPDCCYCTFSRATGTVRIFILFSSKIFVQPQINSTVLTSLVAIADNVQPQLSEPGYEIGI